MSITLTLTVDSREVAKQLIDLAAGITPAAATATIPQQFIQSAPIATQAPQSYAPVQPPVAAPPVVPPAAPAPVQAPVAPPPTYDYDALARAASTLMDAGKQQELIGLLGSFKVQALTQLSKERYGEFATALRGMGAQI